MPASNTNPSYQAIAPTTDAGPAQVISHGVAGVPFNSSDQHSAAAQCTDLPTTGQTLVVTDIIISVDTAMWVKIEEQTTGNVIWGPHYFPANSGPMQFTPRGKLKHSAANKYFQVITSVAGNITCDLYYFSEP